MAITRVGTIRVYAGDKARTLDFYVNKLGLKMPRRRAHRPEAHCIEVALTGTETHLALFASPGI